MAEESTPPGDGAPAAEDEARTRLPFPDSLCHSCAAPPRYITNTRGSTFIYCPILKSYPPQPMLTCDRYIPKSDPPKG